MVLQTFNIGKRCARCGGCGFVITERVEESGPEWRSFSKEEYEIDARDRESLKI